MTARGDIAEALADLGAAVFPCRHRSEGKYPAKTPYTFAGFKDATTDEAQIREWWTKWPEALVGVWAGASGLVVADIDMGEGKDGWSSIFAAGLETTLLDQTFTYSTMSGGDHFIFAAPEGVNLGPTQDHVTPAGEVLEDVDRRAGASYFIWHGTTVPADRSVFAPAPTWLCTPSPDSTDNPYAGTIDEWMARCAKGEPSPLIQAWVESIPPDISHTQMIEGQRTLVAYGIEGEAGVPWAIERFRAAYLSGQWDTKQWSRQWTLGLEGAIAKFGAFPPGPRDIGVGDSYLEAVNRIQDPAFLDVFTTLPPSGAKEAMRERVAYLASVALGEGLPVLDAANIAWTSAAARESIRRHLPEDEAKVEVWNVVTEALARPVAEETPHVPDAPQEPQEGAQEPQKPRVELLTQRERTAAQAIRSAKWGDCRWWGDQFMDVMEEIHSVLSEPYYRLNRWYILSMAFADRAVIETEAGSKIILNFYGGQLGPSNSGKSEALEPVIEMGKLLNEQSGDNPDIGGDATAAALTQTLIRRDGLVSLFHSDEADATILNWKNQNGEFRGMKQRITELYGGRVPAIDRSTQKDISGIHAKAYLNVHLIGIDDRITDAISPADWIDGFINRFVWAKGERKYRTDEMRRLRIRRPGSARTVGRSQPSWYVDWVAKLRLFRSRIGPEAEPGPFAMDVMDDVLDRHVETEKRFEAIAVSSLGYTDRVDPTFRRLGVYVLKCAALVALSEDRRTVQMSDYLIAMEQVEEWAENALDLVRRTDLSPRARQVNRLAETIKVKGGRMTKSAIYREETYAGDSRFAEGLIKELEAQKRAEVVTLQGQEPIVRLLGDSA